MNDVCSAPAVGGQCLYFDGKGFDVCFQSVQYAPVTVSPAVDGLFHVSYNQAVCSLRQTFEQQQTEIVPLHTRSILKFINHYVAYGCSYLFEYKRGISFFYQVMKQRVGIRQQEAIVLMVQFAYLFVYIGQQTDIVYVAQGELAGIGQHIVPASIFFRFIQQGNQFFFCQAYDSVAYGGGFFHPFVGAVQTFFHCYIADAVIQFARL